MKKENKGLKVTALASSAALIGAFGTANASVNELLNYEDLGSGSELRSSLITADAINAFTLNSEIEIHCGEGKCGEGKCGEKSGKKVEKTKGDAKATGTMKAAEASEGKSEAKGKSMEMKPANAQPAEGKGGSDPKKAKKKKATSMEAPN